jgi:hypothetical protein
MSQGKTKEEAARNIVDAIKSVLAVRLAQLAQNTANNGCCPDRYEGEESYRLHDLELTAV